MHQSELSTTAA